MDGPAAHDVRNPLNKSGFGRVRAVSRHLARLTWGTALAVASWSAGAAAAADDADDALPAVEDILANPLDDAAYARTERCLSFSRYRRIEIIDEYTLLFRSRGDRAWLNVLPRRCPGLDRDMLLVLEHRGPRLCRLDRFQGASRIGGSVGTPLCAFGSFEPVRRDNVDAILGALQSAGRNPAVRRTVRGGADNPPP